jgi:hypothetical protein
LETADELQAFLTATTPDGLRGRLLASGEARAIIRRAGVLPDDAPAFNPALDSDLSDYGFSLLRASLAYRELGGNQELWQLGFRRAGEALDSLVRNGATEDVRRGFLRLMAAAAFHLASYSAMAFALLAQGPADQNLAPAEQAIISLILRDLNALRTQIRGWLRDDDHSDEALALDLAEGGADDDDVIADIATTSIFRALAYFDLALASGEPGLHAQAIELLRNSLALARDANAVSLWWVARVALNLIDDLWTNSLHQRIPQDGPQGSRNYPTVREIFLASLYSRKVAEIELWPSQISAAQRATDLSDDMVVSLPTSAGKTRIAEIAALMSLSCGRRVLVVTPLRALSAQTERSFRRTFSSLGFSVSSLYGASGVLPGDEDALRIRNIVIATPEKLDFALRADPSLIDDIGLIILDEGHLIGPNEREIRYEVLVQRMLRRADAGNRRIVCLSAVLPEGQQLRDLNSWIRSDAPGDPVQSGWRPTRQRYGMLIWQRTFARLAFDLQDGGPFIPRFIEQEPAIRPRRTPFPKDTRELTIAAAWRFADEGKRTLIFCTQRDHVEGYATAIIDLVERGFIARLLDESAEIDRALAVGEEWLGSTHPAVRCLILGIAIHHARLPSPFLRELERLLAVGTLKVVVASPTLAQGLNLNAAVLLVPNLYRAGQLLSGEEFANVAGRAGRAFVDTEGFIVHVSYEGEGWRLRSWRELVRSARARTLRSGLVQIVSEIISRLAGAGIIRRPDAMEYLANNRDAWDAAGGGDDESTENLIERLDTAILSLIEALDADAANLPQLLDDALNGSLWARQLGRAPETVQKRYRGVLQARAHLIWATTAPDQRRGHFAMGVGLDAGVAIDAIADQLTENLDQADLAGIAGDAQALSRALIRLGERLLVIRPFAPEDELPDDWRVQLTAWVSGRPVEEIGPDNMRLIEEVFVYRLVWALEAIRMRRTILGGHGGLIEGVATSCLDAGLRSLRMALLVRAGLPSRRAAIAAITDQDPQFIDVAGMLEWLRSDAIVALTDEGEWPTAETALLWKQFRNDVLSSQIEGWTCEERHCEVDEGSYRLEPESDRPYRVELLRRGETVWVCTPDFKRVVKLKAAVRNPRPSVMTARFVRRHNNVVIRRAGRGVARWIEN